MDIEATVLTAAFTIGGGIFTLVVGEIFKKAVLEPVHDLKREIARLAYTLDYYAREMPNGPKNMEARDEFRKHACQLREKMHLVLMFDAWTQILRLPSEKDVMLASRELIGYSNRPAKPDPLVDPDPVPGIRRRLRISHADDFFEK